VIGGIGLQWMVPIFVSGTQGESTLLGALRLFRLLRVFKLIKLIFQGDLSWTESDRFQAFMTSIIAVNAILMAVELDHPPASQWGILEQILLVIYLFELAVNMKHQGRDYFWWHENVTWNYLDLTIVVGAVVDLWMLPLIDYVATLGDSKGSITNNPSLSSAMRLLRLMRLLRVLRLLKLLRAIPPLFRLLRGVLESVKAMGWVLVLAFLMVYAVAIFWTTAIGHGHITPAGCAEDPTLKCCPLSTEPCFRSVAESMFALFLMMNGEFADAEPFFISAWVRVVFVVYMVMANWAILAILTSVVSDNMIASSIRAMEEDKLVEQRSHDKEQEHRLHDIFGIIRDSGKDGVITEDDWNKIVEDPLSLSELCEATESKLPQLQDAFKVLSDQRSDRLSKHTGMTDQLEKNVDHMPRALQYHQFVDYMKAGEKPADKRGVMKLLAKMAHLESEVEKVLERKGM